MVIRSWTTRISETAVHRRLFWQVTVPIVGVGILLLAIGVYGAWRVHRLHRRGADIITENVAGIRKAEELRGIVRESRYRLKRFLSTDDERHLQVIVEILPKLEQWRQETGTLNQRSDAGLLVQQICGGLQQFTSAFTRLQNEDDVQVRHERIIELVDSTIPERILPFVQEFVTLNDQQVDRSSERAQMTANRLMFGLLLLGTCGGVAGLFVGYGIARRMSRTIVEVAISLRDVAGKLDQVGGPAAVTAAPGIQDLEAVLQIIAQRISKVVERLQESERETLRAEQLAAMGQLAAGLAHEIRNPLTSMKTIVQLAERPADLSTQDLMILDEEITRLENSVQTLLDFARPPQAEKHEISLRELLEQPVVLMSRRAERRKINLIFDPPSSDVRVIVDAVQIRQVVLNLLLNALEAAGLGGTVRLEGIAGARADAVCGDLDEDFPDRIVGSAGTVCIRVTDNGKGLPEDLGDRIFDPFVSTKETGTGLGLSICRRIVGDHGGQIMAKKHTRAGAVFVVRLPAALPSTGDSRLVASDARQGQPGSSMPE